MYFHDHSKIQYFQYSIFWSKIDERSFPLKNIIHGKSQNVFLRCYIDAEIHRNLQSLVFQVYFEMLKLLSDQLPKFQVIWASPCSKHLYTFLAYFHLISAAASTNVTFNIGFTGSNKAGLQIDSNGCNPSKKYFYHDLS